MRALAAEAARDFGSGASPTSRATAALAASLGLPLDRAHRGPARPHRGWRRRGRPAARPHQGLRRRAGAGADRRRRLAAAGHPRHRARSSCRAWAPGAGCPWRSCRSAGPSAQRRLTALGCQPGLRETADGPFVTDNGNWILDCGIPAQNDAAALDREIRRIPGVVDTGFFLGTAERVLVAEDSSHPGPEARRATRDARNGAAPFPTLFHGGRLRWSSGSSASAAWA